MNIKTFRLTPWHVDRPRNVLVNDRSGGEVPIPEFARFVGDDRLQAAYAIASVGSVDAGLLWLLAAYCDGKHPGRLPTSDAEKRDWDVIRNEYEEVCGKQGLVQSEPL